MKTKKFNKIILLIIFLLFSQNAFAEKYRLACKIGAFNLEGVAFSDKTRFYNKIMDFDVDTEVGIYSPDLRAESDEVIIHGLWPDAKFSQTSGSQELAWNNELLMDDGTEGKPWTKYKYISFINKKTNRDKKNERVLNITIQDWRLDDKKIKPKVIQDIEVRKKKMELEKGNITQEEYNNWYKNRKELTNQDPESLPKKLHNTYKFEFKCIKSSV